MSPDGSSAETAGLLVFVPSLNWRRNRTMDFLNRLESDPHFANWQVRFFDHKVRTFSRGKMEDVALDLADQIRTWSGETGAVPWAREIILVGHSMGGVLAREAMMHDSSRSDRRIITPGVPHWTERVSRVVLIASPNAGYEVRRLPLYARIALAFVSLFGPFLLSNLQEGSDFITNLRLRWFRFMTQNHPDSAVSKDLHVVQVLGQNDRIISREKILDADFMPNAATLDIRDAGHSDIIDLSTAADPEARYRRLRTAMLDDLPAFADVEMEDSKPVVFILHGIRSSKNADWVGTLEGIIRNVDEADAHRTDQSDWSQAETVTPSYGYFGSLHFVNPWKRRSNARKLLQWYGERYITHNPDNFYFVGHSNGTFMLGRCLQNIPSMRFRRIYLAASVLPKEYAWGNVIQRRQLGHYDQEGRWVTGAIHSDGGRRDVPVGWLCSILHGLEISIPRKPRTADIGTGGFDGFNELNSTHMEHRYAGGHGDMLVPVGDRAGRRQRMETRLREVADFIRYNQPHTAPEIKDAPLFSWASRLLGTASKLHFILLLAGILVAIPFGLPQMLVAALVALYLLLVVVNTF